MVRCWGNFIRTWLSNVIFEVRSTTDCLASAPPVFCVGLNKLPQLAERLLEDRDFSLSPLVCVGAVWATVMGRLNHFMQWPHRTAGFEGTTNLEASGIRFDVE